MRSVSATQIYSQNLTFTFVNFFYGKRSKFNASSRDTLEMYPFWKSISWWVYVLSGSLSNTVKPECITVSVTFDRKRITHTNCGCQSDIQWCRHVVALCLYRIEHPFKAEIRAPVSESLSRLQRDQLQKFAQYLISELPTQVLPTAQRLLDQLCGYTPSDVKIPIAERPETDPNLLSPSSMPINLIQGAPDPTAGPSIDDISMWTLDEDKLNSKLKRTLMKFVQIMPASVTDFGQVYPQSMTPPASSEFNTLLRPIRGKEPEPVWNLLSIVRELCMRQDPNSLLILDIITQQCVNIDSLVVWWFTSRTAAHYYPNSGNRSGNAGANRNRSSGSAVSSTVAGQQCCATLMDEIIDLWTLLILNPRLGSDEKGSLVHTMRLYHVYCIHKIQTNQGTCLQFKRNELRNFQVSSPDLLNVKVAVQLFSNKVFINDFGFVGLFAWAIWLFVLKNLI